MNYPEYREVLKKIQPELDRMRRESVFAEYAESSTPAIRYREIVGEKETDPRSMGLTCEPPKILEDHIRLMADIQNNPSDGLKAHYVRLAWGIGRGNRVLRELKALG